MCRTNEASGRKIICSRSTESEIHVLKKWERIQQTPDIDLTLQLTPILIICQL